MSDPVSHSENAEGDLFETAPDVGKLKRLGVAAGVVALVVAGAGVASRIHATSELRTAASDSALPDVAVIAPTKPGASAGLVLPGTIQAWNSAAINARTNGYVKRWLADIGDQVRAGQPLAVLDAPEVDQQLAQAAADYQTALANQRLAETTSRRWQLMLSQDAVSRQEADEKAGDLAAKSALANSALANVKRLRAMQGFERLSAPFDGMVTSRSAQIGALVSTTNASAPPLFTVSDVHRMRIYVRVPQSYSAMLHAGLKATLTLPEFPGRQFAAELTRSAGAVDPQSGAVLVELQSDNPDRALKPGAFSQVRFDTGAVQGNTLELPSSAIIYGANGPSIAVVDAQGVVSVRQVAIARDEGNTVLVGGALATTDKVIDSPPDAVKSGDKVRVTQTETAGGAAHGK
ncbi:MAG TPA: efflux RND transporter periplasmic adaptor subunit [Novosphingobium sp.]|nr:efflux RND transporter periplasmic adaptor subunit [Novosphingobium sp.]